MINCRHFGIKAPQKRGMIKGHLGICSGQGTLRCTCEEQTSIRSLNRQSAI